MPSDRSVRLTPAGRVLGTAAALALLAGTLVLADRAVGLPWSEPDCTVRVGDGERELTAEQARRLTTLAGVAVREGLTAERLGVAAAAALQGDVEGRAVDALAGVPAGSSPDAASLALARVLLGADDAALTCRAAPAQVAPQPELPSGLTARAEVLRAQVDLVFGDPPLGGFAPGGVDSGHIQGSAHYDGRALDVFFRPVDAANQRRGWTLAQWAVAHAEELAISTVIFDRQVWTAARSAEGWRPYAVPDRPGDPAVLAHEDHVHLDVAAGG